ncbi:MAG: glycoside hydrolase family 5 protein [Mobilitalea sp.]
MEFIRAKGKEIYAGNEILLLRGFGLGGWFLPEGYMWKLGASGDRPRKMEAMIEKLCGKNYAEAFWQSYLDYYITEKDIEFIAKEGFNSVRLPLNARHLYERENQKLILNQDMFARIDQLIEWCRKYQIYVILDMHGAPGGQTGQNIDDCEADQPYLFMDQRYEEELIFLWRELAKRYCKDKTVAGYDLLNEPLPNFFQQYNHKVLPLYQKLIREIREIDRNHMIILEGVHWATDFSIFESFTKEEAADNIMLQFHKYWNNPDAESLQDFILWSDQLNIPLFMGEGGENNYDWYTTAFPLYERLNISWSFWSYKKMECDNSPITFTIPMGWSELTGWMEGKGEMTQERAIIILDRFLQSIRNSKVNEGVLHAIKREVPVKIPCEAYQEFSIVSKRIPGAKLRITDPVSIIFENGRTNEVDYRRLGGEKQPDEENIMVQLFSGDRISYLFHAKQEEVKVIISAEGEGMLMVSIGTENVQIPIKGRRKYVAVLMIIPQEKQWIWLSCVEGNLKVDDMFLE